MSHPWGGAPRPAARPTPRGGRLEIRRPFQQLERTLTPTPWKRGCPGPQEEGPSVRWSLGPPKGGVRLLEAPGPGRWPGSPQDARPALTQRQAVGSAHDRPEAVHLRVLLAVRLPHHLALQDLLPPTPQLLGHGCDGDDRRKGRGCAGMGTGPRDTGLSGAADVDQLLEEMQP